jgi:hypothetical protein
MSEAASLTQSDAMNPNTYAFVAATALMTSISFTIFVLNVIAVVLTHVL